MSGHQETFQKAMSMGHSAAWDQQWQQAEGHYRAALAEFPDHGGALTSLGLALFEQKKYEEALVQYLRAARVLPGDAVPLEKAARIYELLGKPGEAVKASLQAAELQLKVQEVQRAVQNWLTVVKLQPENMTARTRLGMVYERTGRKPEAVTEYLVAAGILQRSGDLAKAVQLADYALKLMPENPEARKAINMLRSGQMLARPSRPKAEAAPEKAAEPARATIPAAVAGLDPVAEARKEAMEQLAAILFEQAEDGSGGKGQARRGLSALAKGIPGLSDENTRTRILLHVSQAIDSLTHNQDSQAAAELERAENAGLAHPSVHFLLGMLLNRSDRGKALRYLRQSVKHPAFALASNLLIGQNYEDQENLPEAAAAYLQALRVADLETVPEKQREELDQIYESMTEGQALQNAGESGLKNICETVTAQLMRPGWRDFLVAARQQLPGGAAGGAPTPLAEMLLETRGSQVVELLSKVRQLAAQSKFRSALEEAFYALQFAPTYLPLHIQIGELLLQEGHTQPAVNKFLIVANLYQLRGEADQAARLLNRVMGMVPTDVSVRMALINLLAAQGRVDEALQQYTDLAEFYYQMSDLEHARSTYMAALRLPQPGKGGRATSVKILHRVADIHMQQLELREAIKMYEQIRTFAPDDLAARTSLVELNLRLGQDEPALTELDGFTSYLEGQNRREQAIEFLEGLLKERPERLDLRKRLADLYQRSGKIEQAVTQLDAIADGLLAAKNRPAAIQVLEMIVALNPPNVADYRAALAKLRGG